MNGGCDYELPRHRHFSLMRAVWSVLCDNLEKFYLKFNCINVLHGNWMLTRVSRKHCAIYGDRFLCQCRKNKTWIDGNARGHNQHCDYWCPSAKSPGHQCPQWLIDNHCIWLISCRYFIFKLNNISKWNQILTEMIRLFSFDAWYLWCCR